MVWYWQKTEILNTELYDLAHDKKLKLNAAAYRLIITKKYQAQLRRFLPASSYRPETANTWPDAGIEATVVLIGGCSRLYPSFCPGVKPFRTAKAWMKQHACLTECLNLF